MKPCFLFFFSSSSSSTQSPPTQCWLPRNSQETILEPRWQTAGPETCRGRTTNWTAPPGNWAQSDRTGNLRTGTELKQLLFSAVLPSFLLSFFLSFFVSCAVWRQTPSGDTSSAPSPNQPIIFQNSQQAKYYPTKMCSSPSTCVCCEELNLLI